MVTNMKRLLSILLCFILVFSFAACKADDSKTADTVDIEYYAKLGRIPETEYTLGTDVDKVKDELSKKLEAQEEEETDSDHNHHHDTAEFIYDVIEGENNVLIDNGTNCYYYVKENKDKGISYIVNYDTAFGFEIGTVSIEIEEALEGLNFTEEDVTEENAFFATYVYNGTLLKGTFGDTVVLFVFQDNALFATAMYDSKNWK